MATEYMYSESTRRVAMVDFFPFGATYPIQAEIFQVYFHDDGNILNPQPQQIAKAYVTDLQELDSVLKSFALVWRECETFLDAMQCLVTDYEERKARVNRKVFRNA